MGTVKLKPGDIVDRAAFQAELGGRPHGQRISPSVSSNSVFLFLDPAKEEAAGSICGVVADGAFHMVGEGSVGDHTTKRGNHVMLAHREEGRPLRLFIRLHTGMYLYAGDFELDREMPFYRIDMPEEREEMVTRDAYVFRLRPVGRHAPLPPSSLPRPAGAFHPVETLPSVLAAPGWREKTSVERETERLLGDYCRRLSAGGHDVVTVRIAPGEGFETVGVPLVDRTTDTVIVSPGSTSRKAVRAAVGEALDLQRLVGTARACIVLPSEPREDVLALIEHVGLAATWPVGREWHGPESPAPSRGPR